MNPEWPDNTSHSEDQGEHIDPVCGMSVDPREAAGKAEYKGKTYYFCNVACEESFRESPESFLQQQLPAATAVESETERDPVCGMKVKPKEAAATEEYQGEKHYF